MDDSNLLEKIKKDTKIFSNILWDTLTPFERERVLKRIKNQMPQIQSRYNLYEVNSTSNGTETIDQAPQSQEMVKPEPVKLGEDDKELKSDSVDGLQPEEDTNIDNKFNEWDLKTKYRVAFADMIEQRTTIMKFLLDNFGIESVEKFFKYDNPQWAEQLKVGKVKKIFAKMISKLAPSLLMRRLAGIIISQAQYLVGIDHVAIIELTNGYEKLEISNCPVLKQFNKTLKALKFNNLEKRYICAFACVPVLNQMCAVGNCSLKANYTDKGCHLIVNLGIKESKEFEQAQASISINNGT